MADAKNLGLLTLHIRKYFSFQNRILSVFYVHRFVAACLPVDLVFSFDALLSYDVKHWSEMLMTSQRVLSAFEISTSCAQVAMSTFTASLHAQEMAFASSRDDVIEKIEDLASLRPNVHHAVVDSISAAFGEFNEIERQAIAVVVVDATNARDVTLFSDLKVSKI